MAGLHFEIGLVRPDCRRTPGGPETQPCGMAGTAQVLSG
jgi:hypothetical protein